MCGASLPSNRNALFTGFVLAVNGVASYHIVQINQN